MALKDLLGASIALISPAARAVYFPGIPELFVVIESIIGLIETAKCNREALPVMKEYMTEVRNTIKEHESIINREHTPALMNALNDWEKFLFQYTKPKMKKLLSILTADKTSRKIQDLFSNLSSALASASLHVNLDSNRILNQLQNKQNIADNKLNNIMDDQTLTNKKLDEILKLVVQNEFVTTACFHGAFLAKEVLEELKLEPQWIKPGTDAHTGENMLTKVMYCNASEAAKIHIGVVGDNIDKYYVRAYISARLNSDLFARNFGILQEENNYYMITEWPALGTLHAYLKQNRDITWKEKIRMAVRLARAVAFCHSKLIVHHDICSHNAIVDKSRNVKLGNFHRSRGLKDITTSVNGETENVRWLCPEKVRDGKVSYTKEADVYSFGMLMWEITSHEVPFADKTHSEVFEQQKKACIRPLIVDGTPKAYEKIMRGCWAQDPIRRPAMEEVVKELESLESRYENDTQSMYSESVASLDDIPTTPPQSNVTIQTAIKLHNQKNHKEAFDQFQILADGETPDARANFYVGLYLMDQKIQHEKDPDIGESYLEVASELGFTQAVQYRAQSKMAAATELRKEFLAKGQEEDADAIQERMKSECLPLFLQGANSGDLRCMKDLAHYGANLGDEDSYKLGMKMLKDKLTQQISEKDKNTINDYLTRLQTLGEKFNKE